MAGSDSFGEPTPPCDHVIAADRVVWSTIEAGTVTTEQLVSECVNVGVRNPRLSYLDLVREVSRQTLLDCPGCSESVHLREAASSVNLFLARPDLLAALVAAADRLAPG